MLFEWFENNENNSIATFCIIPHNEELPPEERKKNWNYFDYVTITLHRCARLSLLSHTLLPLLPFSRVNRRKLKCRILNSFFFAIGDKGKTTIKLLLNGISERIKRTKWAYKVICMIPVKIYSVLLSHQIVTKKRLIWKKILNQHITQEKPFAFQSPGSHHFLSERITRFSYHITQRFS